VNKRSARSFVVERALAFLRRALRSSEREKLTKKPLILVVQSSDTCLALVSKLVRSLGYDVCACLPGELPERRRWHMFAAAVVNERRCVPADLSIDVVCTSEGLSLTSMRYCLARFTGGGGGGEALQGWGRYRVVGQSGCGFLDRGGEHDRPAHFPEGHRVMELVSTRPRAS
jgi:hypothetical protein